MLQGNIWDLHCDPSHDSCQQATPEHALIALDLCIIQVALTHQGPGLAWDQAKYPHGLTQKHPK